MASRTARLLWASGCIGAAELDHAKSLKFLIKPPVLHYKRSTYCLPVGLTSFFQCFTAGVQRMPSSVRATSD